MDESFVVQSAGGDVPAALGDTFSSRGLLHGMRRGVPLGLSSIALGLVFGVLSRQAGLTLAQACLMSALVNAGSSQLIALGMWATPVPLLPVVATTLLVNMRLVLMGMTLRPWNAKLPAPAGSGPISS